MLLPLAICLPGPVYRRSLSDLVEGSVEGVR